MLGSSAGAWRGIDYTRGFWLAHPLSGVGLDRFRGGKFPWLAFRHGKYEYGVSPAGVEGPDSIFCRDGELENHGGA